MEAAGTMDERNGPLDHSALENAARFPQLPQPAPSGVSQTRTINPSRPLLSDTSFWSRRWGPPHRALGCGTDVPQDGVRRFICTSREFGEALTSPNRRWDRVPYRYKGHSVGTSLLLELLAASDHAQSQRTAAP